MDLYTASFDYPRPPVRVSVAGNTPLGNTTTQLPGSSASRNVSLPNTSGTNGQPGTSTSNPPTATVDHADEEWKAVQAKCLDITSREGCLVTATREGTRTDSSSVPQTFNADGEASRPVVETPIYNYHLSGEYGTVMAARGHLLREAPSDKRLTIKVARSEILESPLADISTVKADVLSRLMPIALESKTRISIINIATRGATASAGAVLTTADGVSPGETEAAWTKGEDCTTQAPGHDRNSSANSSIGSSIDSKDLARGKRQAKKDRTTTDDSSSADVKPPSEDGKPISVKSERPRTYGLETERLCEIVIAGSMENVHFAKVKCLVMLDQLVR